MSSTPSGGADAMTGLPPGVEVGQLSQRFVAYLIDVALPVVASVLLTLVVPALSGAGRVVLAVVLVFIIVGWAGYLVFRLGEFAATPGMAAMKLQVVGFYDGRPIGFSRAFIRGVILVLLSVSVVGVIIMAIVMLLHPRHQGWHDLAVQSVMIKQRQLAPPVSADRASSAQTAPTTPTARTARTAPISAVSPNPSPLTPPDGITAGPIVTRPHDGPPAEPVLVPPEAQGPVPTSPATPPLAADLAAPSSPEPVPEPPRAAPAEAQTQEPPYDGAADPETEDAEPVGAKAEDDSRTNADPANADPANADPANAKVGWSAVLDDGRQIAVEGLVLLGRNPQPRPGEEDAQLIKIADDTRTVSKSHLAIGIDATGLFVVDRGSTNGSIVTTPSGTSTRCGVGDIVYATDGTIVSLGDHWLRIRRD